MWDTVKGPPPDLKVKTSFTPSSGFTLGKLVCSEHTPVEQKQHEKHENYHWRLLLHCYQNKIC